MAHSVSCPLFSCMICTVTHGLPAAAPLSMRAPPSPQRRLGASAESASQAALPSQPHSHSASQAHSHVPLPPQRSISGATHMGDTGLAAPTNVQGNRLKRTGVDLVSCDFSVGPHICRFSCLHRGMSTRFRLLIFSRSMRPVMSDAPLRVAEAAMHTNLFTTAGEQSAYWRTSQETRRVQMISRTQYCTPFVMQIRPLMATNLWALLTS
jgi:hypothetical protein